MSFIRKYFRKVTPVFIIAGAGGSLSIVTLVYIFFVSETNYGEFVREILVVLSLIFCSAFVFDRYLVDKYSYKRLLLVQVILLTVLTVTYMVINRKTTVSIENNSIGIPVLYTDDGLKKEQIPRSFLFDRVLKIKTDSIVRIDMSLFNDPEFNLGVWLWTYKNWAPKHEKELDTTIGGKKYRLEVYFNKASLGEKEFIFQELKHKYLYKK